MKTVTTGPRRNGSKRTYDPGSDRYQGALIGYVQQTPVIATIGYLELWPEHSALFFNEVGDSSTGQQHIVRFETMEIKGDQAILYQGDAVIASIAPFEEWPVDVDRCKANWREWLTWQEWRRPLDIANAAEYRKSFHP
jgi:hypothetical protein